MDKIIRFDLRNPRAKRLLRLPAGVEGDKSLMMWKELCRTGRYVTDGESHEIDAGFLNRMVDSFNRRRAKGIEVPCPIGHNHDPENRRGRMVYLETRKNERGGVSLWGIIEFTDREAKEKLKHSDVSIDAPADMEDGDGETHQYALEHVAFTDYPVVSGMEGFSDVSFSVIDRQEKLAEKINEKFTLDALIAKMGLTRKFNSPSDVYSAIWREFQKLKARDKAGEIPDGNHKEMEDSEMSQNAEKFSDERGRLDGEAELSRKKRRKFAEDETEEQEKDFESEENGEDKEFDDGDDEEFSEDENEDRDEDEEDEEDEETPSRKKRRRKFSRDGAYHRLLRENRTMKIDGMRRDGLITAEQSNEMKRRFCSDQAISFSLRHRSDREFKDACKILSMSAGRSYGEKTGVQFSAYRADEPTNPLLDAINAKFNR